jgi:uncharacterized protein YuzE
MHIRYDDEVDALYIRLIDEPSEVTTRRVSEDVAINYAPGGEIVGIEVLAASEHVFRTGEPPTVTLENLIALTG